MIKTIINTENINDAEVVFLSAPYEKTASSHKGTAAGPHAVIEQLNHQIEFFDRRFKKTPCDFIKIAHQDMVELDKFSPKEAKDKILGVATDLLGKDKFIFLLGGEHAVSIGVFEALAQKYDPKDVTIMQIDAHCDLREDDSDYTDTPSEFAHSTVMRHASSLGFPLVQVGIRTYSEDEYNYFSDPKNNVTVFEWGNQSEKRKTPIEDILSSIKTKYLYITIDVDGFDPAYMPGTGTAVQGGLSWWYGVELLQKAISNFELVGADIVEVSPLPDSVLTEYGAAQLAYSMIAEKFAKRLK
ncbi:agmatinase [Patescibacteria group bacterium]|nr:agmatinase [Patescibacteria group bacterium]